ncbi:hypothetical protein [Clostridium gasigenes]|uniref:Uncharacterized protein n=1 Tax=Clostridium gasigenes TaxID=94869 RepID=A0A7X0VQ12_9CLOT|nr:hypothetical protein [Clostridium gasigenes]MBB6713508.1 hypothetical protein [Clostridium gasigenes]
MNKIILDANQRKKSGGFVLNLNNIESIENLHLNLTNIIEECKEEISKQNFNSAKDLLNLSLKLSDYGDEEVNNIKLKYYFENISYKYENNKKADINVCMDLLLDIKMFFSIVHSQHRLNNPETEIMINNLNKVKESILIEELLEKEIGNYEDYGSIKKIEELEEFSKEYSLKEIEELKVAYVSKINETIISLKDKPSDLAISSIKKILENKYPTDYLVSEEFLNIIIKDNYKNIENYNALLEFTDKAYLVYRFNISSSLEEKIKVLYSNLIPNYIELPIILKEYVVNQLIVIKEQYFIVSEFFEVLNNIIKKVNMENKSNAIPI